MPLTGPALAVLRRLDSERTAETAGLVFQRNGAAVPMNHLSKQLAKFTTAAGVEKNLTAYGLRHSAGTRWALAGVPLFIIARLLGTSVAMVERHYAAYAPDAGAQYLERMLGAGLGAQVEAVA